MAAKTKRSGFSTLFNAVGFVFAAVLVLHAVFVLTGFEATNGLTTSVARAAEPLAVFFPGLLDAGNPTLQVLADYGLAAVFWVLVAGLLGRIFG